MALIIFENFLNFSFGINTSLSKMSLLEVIVPGRLRSMLYPWGVKTNHDMAIKYRINVFVDLSSFNLKNYVLMN